MNKFFLVIQPGFEEASERELLRYLPQLREVKKSLGGLEFETEMQNGLALNHALKIPSRVLLRIFHGKCKKIEDLKAAIKNLNLNQYFNASPKVQFSSVKSKLYHKQKISEQIERFIRTTFEFEKSETKQALQLRFDHDWLTISIDTSGAPLYRRTPEKKVLDAPMRETLASALYQTLIHDLTINGDFTLIDPMCGSGTLLSEAFRVNYTTNISDFTFRHFKKNKTSNLKPAPLFPTPKKAWGFDRDSRAIENCAYNFKRAFRGEKPVHFKCQDLFESPELKTDLDTYILTNPPHGNRLKGSAKLELSDYVDLISQMIKTYQPNGLGLLLPAHIDAQKLGTSIGGYTVKSETSFLQSTNKVLFVVLKRA